jgi:hypothetical protein
MRVSGKIVRGMAEVFFSTLMVKDMMVCGNKDIEKDLDLRNIQVDNHMKGKVFSNFRGYHRNLKHGKGKLIIPNDYWYEG